MAFKALVIIVASLTVLATATDDVAQHEVADEKPDDATIVTDDSAVAEVTHVKQGDDLQTGDQDSDGSALLPAYAHHGHHGLPLPYGPLFAPPPPYPGFYGKPYAFGYHHGYHHGYPFFGYGAGYGGGGVYGAGYGYY